MSKIQLCDLCGKASEETVIDDKSLKLQLPTKQGNLNFYIDIRVELAKTRDAVETFQHFCADMGIQCPNDADDLEEDDFMKVFKLQEETIDSLEENKETCVCRKCKNEVLKLALAYGSYNKLQNMLK